MNRDDAPAHRVLITNDDGIESPGLAVLAEAAARQGCDVVVAAPSWDTSGASASLTGVEQHGRLNNRRAAVGDLHVAAFALDASPAMITVAALRGAFGPPPRLVLSGVNRGRNTGRAILHSGTVGAAFTAGLYGVPAIAFSIDSGAPRHWETASAIVEQVLDRVRRAGTSDVLNVNLPDLPLDQVRGLREAPLAAVGAVQTSVTDSGAGYLQVTFGDPEAAAPGTDAALLEEGWVVLSALRPIAEAPPGRLSDLLATRPATRSRVAAGR